MKWPPPDTHTHTPNPHTPPTATSTTQTPCRVAIRSLNELCFLSRHKADSKANSHCLKWHHCPGICLTFCLMHKAESMHNPSLINTFPLFPLCHSPHLYFIPLLTEKEKRKMDSVIFTFSLLKQLLFAQMCLPFCLLQFNSPQHRSGTFSKNICKWHFNSFLTAFTVIICKVNLISSSFYFSWWSLPFLDLVL